MPGKGAARERRKLNMGSYNSNYGNGDSSFFALRQADGKVLGRVRPGVKLSTPQPGMKDYRFFVDPLSPLPRGFEDSEKHGFTGFMSRIGCGYNAFANEADALHYLKTVFGDAFVTFTPAIRNNKFFVLDDMQLEGTTSFMDVDSHFYPIPAFGTVDQPPFSGDINKFCSHILTGKPLPGLSKKYWNNDVQPRVIVAATKNFEGKLGPWVVFAPLYDDAFDSTVIGEGGAYFHVKNNGPLGYGVVDFKNSELFSHILRCTHSPLWYVPEEFIPDLRLKLKPVPSDGDLLADSGVLVNPFADGEPITLGSEENGEKRFSPEDVDKIIQSFISREDREPVSSGEEEITSEEQDTLKEADFLERLSETADRSGFLYDKDDLINFHISLKSSRLTILAGMSGTGKSGLVRSTAGPWDCRKAGSASWPYALPGWMTATFWAMWT